MPSGKWAEIGWKTKSLEENKQEENNMALRLIRIKANTLDRVAVWIK